MTRRLVIRLLLFAVVVLGIVISLSSTDFWWAFGSLAVFGVAAMVFQLSFKPRTVLTVEALESLAWAVHTQWRRELDMGRVHDPMPLDVAFRAADASLSDHWTNISRSSQDQPVDMRGETNRLVDVYQRIPSGRLVIVGGPGSGKSTAAIQLVLDLLELRPPGDLVPVIVHAGAWNPGTTRFPDWLARQLELDYPMLGTDERSGGTVAQQLIAKRLLIPVVDGLDELAEQLREEACRSLDLWQDEFILLCRLTEYTRLVNDFGIMPRAAVVELEPLSFSSVVDYLRRASPRPTPTPSFRSWSHFDRPIPARWAPR